MDSIFHLKYAMDLLSKNFYKLKDVERKFLNSIIDYNESNRVLNLTEKQNNWYISICTKYSTDEIMGGSVGDKLLKQAKKPVHEIEMNHIKTYGNIFTMTENIKKQLKL